ncbi:hypothetical protein H4Q26_003207 [Puccinia striiformis f. sp. tritici PST-130]|nr:hypothetical protein H4Q26_003207 [Puccinia striiformis f. sp. tritici PST-130]
MIYLTSELLKDPRPTLHSRDFDATLFKKKFGKLEKILSNDKHNPLYTQNLATFNIRFERYQEALVQAQEIEVQATQTRDKTVIPTTKSLKIESRTAQTENIALPAPEVTGNIHLDNYLAKKSITEKPIDKKENATKKKLLPLDSSIGDLSISSFTTEPYFEDLEPTTNLPSPALKKITRKPALPILSDSQDDLDEDLATPILNPSTPIPKDEQNNSEDPIKPPARWRAIRERGRDSGSGNHPDPHQKAGEDPRQVPEGNLERRQEINLGSGSTEPARPPETHPEQGNRELRERVEPLDRKEEGFPSSSQKQKEAKIRQEESSTTKRQQSPRSNSLELQPRPNPLEQQPQPKPREYSRNQSRLNNNNPQQAHSNNRENNKRHREESEDLEDASKALSSLSTINHNLTTLEANHDVNTSKLLRVVEKCYVKSAKTLSEISDQLSDPLPVQMGPLEKSLVYHLKKEIDKVSNLVKDIHGTSNHEGIESLTTQIKYLRDTVYNLQNKQKELVNSLPKQSNESISDIFASLRIEIKSLTDIASVLSLVVVRLPRLFRGVAKVWWKTKSAAMGKASWQTWKDLMKAQFNTSTWRSKMKEAFRKEKLDPSVHVISTWCVAQHRRLECISPGLSLKEINEEILERCPGTLANSVNCRLPDLNVDLTVLINTMEDIVTKVNRDRKPFKENSYKRTGAPENPLPDNKKETPPPRRTPASGECFNCGEKGHHRQDCPKPQKKIMEVDGELQPEDPAESDSEPSSDLELIDLLLLSSSYTDGQDTSDPGSEENDPVGGVSTATNTILY